MSEGTSLLSFLDAPVLVGDPTGAVVYVNPAFERSFGVVADRAIGDELAAMFSGGGREAVLGAVARVCGGEGTQHFRVRENGKGFLVVASPIAAERDHVGVILLLTDEPLADERLIAFHREIEEPLSEVLGCLEELIDETGGRRGDRFRIAVEKGISAVGRARKWSEGMNALLTGRAPDLDRPSRFDPAELLQRARGRVAEHYTNKGVELVMMMPSQLPGARAHVDRVESALVRLLQTRLETSIAGESVTVSARVVPSDRGEVLLLAVVDEAATGMGGLPRELESALDALGDGALTLADPTAGRVTALRLPLA